MIKIYTDGSCLNNPGDGGWAAIINDNGKIMPRRVTGTSAKMHRKVVSAIKRARTIGLMPFIDNGSE